MPAPPPCCARAAARPDGRPRRRRGIRDAVSRCGGRTRWRRPPFRAPRAAAGRPRRTAARPSPRYVFDFSVAYERKRRTRRDFAPRRVPGGLIPTALLQECCALLDVGCVARVGLLDALGVGLELLRARRLAAAGGARAARAA